MPSFSYRCLTADGSLREGMLEAVSLELGRGQLQGRGWRILELKTTDGAPPANPRSSLLEAVSSRARPEPHSPHPPSRGEPPTPAKSASGVTAIPRSYHCRAVDSNGIQLEETLLATSIDDARDQLEKRHLKLVGVPVPAAPVPAALPARPRPRLEEAGPARLPDVYSPSLSLRQLTLMTVQLQVMLNAGLSYLRALEAISKSEDLAMASVSHTLADKIQAGFSLSKAMASLPRTFDHLFVSMVRAGEATGRLHLVLGYLSNSLTVEEQRRGRLVSALTYPALVLVACGAMIAFLVYSMVPGYLGLFRQTGGSLPFLTECLLWLSQSPLLAAALVGPPLLLGLLLLSSRSWSGSRQALDYLKFHLPVLQVCYRKALVIRMCRNLSLMASAGINFAEALRTMMIASTGFLPMDRALGLAREALMNGTSLATALGRTEVFPHYLVQAVEAGEEIGQVPGFLNRWADMLEEDLNYSIEAFLQALEPVMLLTVGFLVGIIVLAAFLPVFSLLQTLN